MTRRKKVGLSVVILLGLFALLEAFCRLYLGLGDPPLSRADPEIEYMFVGPRTYHRFGNVVSFNSFSMRSREFDARRKDPNEIRVMVCGDSVINGGALTDQSQLMTTRLERHLASELERPAIVMNVSAGSWGPPNYWAYVQRFGFFEANALVIVASSSDAADAPTFEPIVGIDPSFPNKTPLLASQELITRYIVPRLPQWSPPPPPSQPTQGQFDQSLGAFRSLIGAAQERHIPVVVALHLEQWELNAPETEGHRYLNEAASVMHVKPVEWGQTFADELKAGRNPYRDNIHPNAHGQELMEQTLYPVVLPLVR